MKAIRLIFVDGLGQEKITNAAEVCDEVENIIKMEAQHTFLKDLLAEQYKLFAVDSIILSL